MVKENWPLVTVVVLSFNGKHFLRNCLNSLFSTDYPRLEIILVDNASTDGSIEEAEEEYGLRLTKIIRNERNLGFAEGNNVGARYAKGEYIIFLNQDTIVEPRWVKELATVMKNDSTIGAAQSKLLLLNKPEYLDSAGDFIDAYGWGVGRGNQQKDNGQYDKISEIFSARGAAMMVRSSVFAETGSFDSRFFVIYEDVDLSWRIRLRGYRIIFVPKSRVYHFGGGNLSEGSFSSFHLMKNWLSMVFMNYEFGNWLRYNPLPILAICMTLDAFAGKSEILLSRLRAVIWNLANFPYLWKKRLYVQHVLRTCRDQQIMEYTMRTVVFYSNIIRARSRLGSRISRIL